MGFFNFQPQNDSDKARNAMKYFHNKMVMLYPNQYTDTLDSVIDKVGGTSPSIFMDSLGFTISSIDMSDGQVEDAMEALASASNGGIPKQTKFFQALSNRVSNLTAGDWIEALPGIAGDTAIDVAKGAQQIGNAVIDTGKSLLAVGPLAIVAAVLFILYAKTMQVAGK